MRVMFNVVRSPVEMLQGTLVMCHEFYVKHSSPSGLTPNELKLLKDMDEHIVRAMTSCMEYMIRRNNTEQPTKE